MNYLKRFMLLACCCAAICGNAQETIAPDNSGSCAAGCGCAGSNQTPLGIMTDHVHGKGEWMASYTYMDMMMNGNRSGTAKIDNSDIYRTYIMAPDKMTMQMHMAMVMYGLSDRLTLMAMFGYADNHMTMNMNEAVMHMHMPGMPMVPGSTMTSASSGFADTRIYGLYSLLNKNDQRIIVTLGISLPTGTTAAKGTTMLGDNQRLAYAMQIGSGTFGVLPSVTWVAAKGHFSYGVSAGANINIGKNPQGYRFGNIYNATFWGSYQVFPFLSASLRAEGVVTDKITGYDKDIAVLMYNDPNANSANYGGQRVNVYAGLNFSIPKFSKLHFLLEYGMPVYENLNGPQMSLFANLQAGVQYTF